MIIIETCPDCGHDLQDLNLCTYPPIPAKQCPNCGWRWQGEQEQIVRVPFNPNKLSLADIFLNDVLNGGSNGT